MTKKIFIALLLLALAAGGYGFAGYDSRHIVLDNAFVSGRILRISASADGVVSPYRLERATEVRKDQQLFLIRNNESEANLAQYKEALRSAIMDESLGCNKLASDRAALTRAEAKVAFSQQALDRWQQLGKAGVVTKEMLDSRQLEFDVNAADRAVAERALERSHYENREGVLQRPAVQKAVAQLRSAFVQRRDEAVLAPSDGYVYEVLTYPGRYVKKGDDLLVFIPKEAPVVEANVLESEIAFIQPGSTATVLPDVGGGKVAFSGVIKSIVPSAAATFSQLPRNNLDSNWIKTSQRVPVLITLSEPPRRAADLPLGASVKVIVARGQAGAPRLAHEAAYHGATSASAPASVPGAGADPALATAFNTHLQGILAEFRSEKSGWLRGCK